MHAMDVTRTIRHSIDTSQHLTAREHKNRGLTRTVKANAQTENRRRSAIGGIFHTEFVRCRIRSWL